MDIGWREVKPAGLPAVSTAAQCQVHPLPVPVGRS